MTPISPQHAAALEYASRGWHVFPLKPGLKEPATKNGHHDATVDPARVDAWWSSNPHYNVGVAVAPSNLVVLDVDVGKRKPKLLPDGTYQDLGWKQGRKSASEIEHELTPTLLASGVTLGEDGRPGIHAWYQRPADVPPARIIGFKEGLDIIGDGYIVAAPSYFAESQRHYEWIQLAPIAPLPPVLAHAARTPKPKEIVTVDDTPIVEGGRNNAMFALGCALREQGIGAEALARALDAENKRRFNPPLEDTELGQIVNSVLTRVEVRRDAALGAIVQQEVNEIFAQPTRSAWIRDVALKPLIPSIFYSTGFPTLDTLLSGGFASRQCTGIIGPPSTGKSALVGEWLLSLAKQRPVLHVSLELPREELFVRYAAHQMEFPWVDGIKGRVDQGAMARSVAGLRIRLMGAEDADREDPFRSICDEADAIRRETGEAPIIAIDYVQLMARGAGNEVRHKVGELTMKARTLSQLLDTVVLAVFTTQRTSYSNKKGEEAMRAANDPTAYLGAAKESGDIEFDCATLMYLDVDKLIPGHTKPARIAVARARVGTHGFVGVRARLDIGRFWEDASALQEFAAEERKERQNEATLAAAKQKVIDAINAMPGRAWRDIQAKAAIGSHRTLIDQARNELLEEGVIEKVDRYNEFHQLQKGIAFIVKSPPQNVRTTEGQQ